MLDRTGVSEDEQLAYFRAGLARLPGWAAYVRWRAMTSGDVDIVDVLAVRAALEWALDEPPATPNEGHSDDENAARARVAGGPRIGSASPRARADWRTHGR